MKYPKWLIIFEILCVVIALYEFVRTSDGWTLACGMWTIACIMSQTTYNKLFDKKQ